jgi:hypothetical protein
VKLISLHQPPPIPLLHGVAWAGTTVKVEFDFVVASLQGEIEPCRHATERRAAEGGLEMWHIPRAVVSYRSASIIVSVVCLDCTIDAEADSADAGP